MYSVLLTILGISIIIFLIEGAYVVCNLSSKIHASLLLYIVCCLINNVGYLLEMTAKSSEAAYTATRLLYLGKMNIAFVLLIFMLQYCKVNVKRVVTLALFVFHQVLYGIVLTNDWHHLYYTTIRFDEGGLFPHNVYGHGPVYYLAMVIPYVYLIVCFVTLVRTYKKLGTKEEKHQMFFLLVAPCMSMIGTLVFFTGKTGGFDTGNIGLMFSALFMLVALFKYQLVDTVDMVKNSLADSLVDGLIAVDAYGELSYFNDVAKKIIPSIALHMNKQCFADLVDELETKMVSKEIMSYNDLNYVVRTQDLYQGKFYRGKLYVLADVTESLRHTRQLEEERDRADRANEAKSQFLSSMSHEIRTPMNAIIGMTDVLLRNKPSEEDTAYLYNIKNSGKALLDIINDILDFSKIESGKLDIICTDYELLPMLDDLKMIFDTRIGEKPIQMVYKIDESIPAVLHGDSVRIRQILINLVNNAIKFTDSGCVELTVSYEFLTDEKIDLMVRVKDTGQGIKKEDMDKLFKSFSQVDEIKNHTKEGTGLGLNISKQLVELMDGTIGVESVYGEGSTFFFTIPQKVIEVTKSIDELHKRTEEEIKTFTASKAKVLLVEDNVINVKVADALLSPLQFEMDVAENGLISIDMVKKKEYDLILMDHMMPVMDGIEATQKIRSLDGEYYKKVPILALSADAVTGAREIYLEAGMNDFVSKPIIYNEILVTLHKWLPKEVIDE